MVMFYDYIDMNSYLYYTNCYMNMSHKIFLSMTYDNNKCTVTISGILKGSLSY